MEVKKEESEDRCHSTVQLNKQFPGHKRKFVRVRTQTDKTEQTQVTANRRTAE